MFACDLKKVLEQWAGSSMAWASRKMYLVQPCLRKPHNNACSNTQSTLIVNQTTMCMWNKGTHNTWLTWFDFEVLSEEISCAESCACREDSGDTIASILAQTQACAQRWVLFVNWSGLRTKEQPCWNRPVVLLLQHPVLDSGQPGASFANFSFNL